MFTVIDSGVERWLVILTRGGRLTVHNVTTGYRDVPLYCPLTDSAAFMFPEAIPRSVTELVLTLLRVANTTP